MNNISVFKFEESKEVRTLTDERDGSVWFVLKDVLAAMGTTTPVNVAKASIESVFGDGYNNVAPIQDSLGRTQNVTIISEPAMQKPAFMRCSGRGVPTTTPFKQ